MKFDSYQTGCRKTAIRQFWKLETALAAQATPTIVPESSNSRKPDFDSGDVRCDSHLRNHDKTVKEKYISYVNEKYNCDIEKDYDRFYEKRIN